ncbi:NAD(P)H-quinone oxidoreductase [Thalassotalea ponticola]|uniref:NAD(P)H-quinone oxidoreductase n=1 Tax=Thalassotalea ponticola TaxID=1523392 RepID=UPI0025B4EDAC|nr:NAD(P)H-quinone oxidoreductase [Thalassotalea ponticola]MDN3653103.1 NAD(P)H-quinone oxidoreductase [Thalassotalea ponticola]
MKYIRSLNNHPLSFADTDKPSLSSQQCLIKVRAIGVNRADLLQRDGKYPPPKGESDILGIEVSGDVIALGSDVDSIKIGDRVCGLVAGGGYAQYVAMHQGHMIPLPPHFSYEQGAALSEVFLTAYQSLFTIGHIIPEQSVLIHGGASGVGSAAIKLAKAMGATVTVTVGNEQKAQACAQFGADHVIPYRQQCFVEWSKAHNPKGFDVIVDIVSGSYLNKNISILALDGCIVILSMLGGRYSEPVDIAKLLQKRARIEASTLRNRSDQYKTQLVKDFTEQFFSALCDGSIEPVIDQVFDWSHADEAHQAMAANKNIGKYILRVT